MSLSQHHHRHRLGRILERSHAAGLWVASTLDQSITSTDLEEFSSTTIRWFLEFPGSIPHCMDCYPSMLRPCTTNLLVWFMAINSAWGHQPASRLPPASSASSASSSLEASTLCLVPVHQAGSWLAVTQPPSCHAGCDQPAPLTRSIEQPQQDISSTEKIGNTWLWRKSSDRHRTSLGLCC